MSAAQRPVRIANCSGFYGDRVAAAREMVDGGEIDVLTGDYLAELTMLILAKAQAKDPAGGYAKTFLTQMEAVLGTCLERGIRIVANAGGLNPAGLATAIRTLADRLGLTVQVAYVEGDDLRDNLAVITPPVVGKPVSANAYLGGWGIAQALRADADVVVTGRVTDASLVVGPAAWWHGWATDSWDALAGAVVAGHVIECGPQATGGNYAFAEEITDLRYPGFPIAEVAADGSSVITKHPGTGGLVSVGTVTRAAALRDRRAGLPRPGRHRALRHDPAVARRTRPGRDLGHPRHAAAVDAQGRAQRRGRVPQHDDAGADRAGP